MSADRERPLVYWTQTIALTPEQAEERRKKLGGRVFYYVDENGDPLSEEEAPTRPPIDTVPGLSPLETSILKTELQGRAIGFALVGLFCLGWIVACVVEWLFPGAIW